MKKTKKIAGLIVVGDTTLRNGKFKPLMRLCGTTIIEKTIESMRAADLDEIVVVLGYRAEELKPIVEQTGARVVINHRYTEGNYTSISIGAAALAPDVDGFFLLPGDNPLVRKYTITQMLAKFQNGEAGIVYPCFHGHRGHPPLISSRYIPGILKWQGQGGLQSYLEQFDQQAVEVEACDEGILLGIDYPVDYQQLMEGYWFREIPTDKECQAIMKCFQTPDPVVKHGEKVAEVACSLADLLTRAGYLQNMSLVKAAALLHDIAAGEPQHAEAGARKLAALGFPKVAEIVSFHSDLTISDRGSISANEIVFLADKLVKGERYVTLEQRFQQHLNTYQDHPTVMQRITSRMVNAKKIKKSIEGILDRRLESVDRIFRGGI